MLQLKEQLTPLNVHTANKNAVESMIKEVNIRITELKKQYYVTIEQKEKLSILHRVMSEEDLKIRYENVALKIQKDIDYLK